MASQATWWPALAASMNTTAAGAAQAPTPSAGPAPISMPAVLAAAALVAADAGVSGLLGLGVHWMLLIGVVRCGIEKGGRRGTGEQQAGAVRSRPPSSLNIRLFFFSTGASSS